MDDLVIRLKIGGGSKFTADEVIERFQRTIKATRKEWPECRIQGTWTLKLKREVPKQPPGSYRGN